MYIHSMTAVQQKVKYILFSYRDKEIYLKTKTKKSATATGERERERLP